MIVNWRDRRLSQHDGLSTHVERGDLLFQERQHGHVQRHLYLVTELDIAHRRFADPHTMHEILPVRPRRVASPSRNEAGLPPLRTPGGSSVSFTVATKKGSDPFSDWPNLEIGGKAVISPAVTDFPGTGPEGFQCDWTN